MLLNFGLDSRMRCRQHVQETSMHEITKAMPTTPGGMRNISGEGGGLLHGKSQNFVPEGDLIRFASKCESSRHKKSRFQSRGWLPNGCKPCCDQRTLTRRRFLTRSAQSTLSYSRLPNGCKPCCDQRTLTRRRFLTRSTQSALSYSLTTCVIKM